MITGKFQVTHAGERLDKQMTNLVENQSRQQIQAWIKAGEITVNKEICKPNYRCSENDCIEWAIEEEIAPEILPEDISLDIQYEDEHLLIINKPKGMLVHPTNKIHTNTLVNGLKYHCNTLSDISGADRPGIVHRLDKDTSGLLIVAKSNEIHAALKEQFQSHTVKRVYEAIVFGVLQHEQGIIKAPIGRNPKNRLQMAVVPNGKPSETHFHILKTFKEHTHLECELKTGRTHQIRVHFKYLNHPIVGDPLYVRKKSSIISGQALFAKRLQFFHPFLKKEMCFEVEQPTDFKQVLKQLNARE